MTEERKIEVGEIVLSYSPEKADTDSDPVLYGTAGATAAEAARRVAYSKQKDEEKPERPAANKGDGNNALAWDLMIDGPLVDLLIGSASPDPHCPECRCDTRCEAHALTCSRRALLIVHETPEQRAAREAARKRMACWLDVSDRPFSLAYARWFVEEHARWLMI